MGDPFLTSWWIGTGSVEQIIASLFIVEDIFENSHSREFLPFTLPSLYWLPSHSNLPNLPEVVQLL
jgi:hypothetical protein